MITWKARMQTANQMRRDFTYPNEKWDQKWEDNWNVDYLSQSAKKHHQENTCEVRGVKSSALNSVYKEFKYRFFYQKTKRIPVRGVRMQIDYLPRNNIKNNRFLYKKRQIPVRIKKIPVRGVSAKNPQCYKKACYNRYESKYWIKNRMSVWINTYKYTWITL